MDFVLKEEFDIKQEQEDIEANFRIIEFEHIFKAEPTDREFLYDDQNTRNGYLKIESMEEKSQIVCSTRNYNDIKLEPIGRVDSMGPKNDNRNFEPIYRDHSYARAYQPFIDRTRKQDPRLSEIKKKLKAKVKNPPFEPQICSICGELFVRRWIFERHLIRHGTNRSLFECDVCGFKCKLMKHLQGHILRLHTTTTGNVKVTCNVCGNSYHRDYLRRHMSTHSTKHLEPSLECTQCGKLFRVQANLTSHSRLHRKKKAPCKVCGKFFTFPRTLRVHERIHTGEKPFLCWICGKRFRGKTTLNTHLTVHWTGKNFPCNLCEAKFKNPNGLDTHRRRVHFKIVKAIRPEPNTVKLLAPINKRVTLVNLSQNVKPINYVKVKTYSKYNKN